MEQFVNFIIRPPRAEYDPDNDLLDQEFILKGKWFQRKDVEVKNSRGDVLQCSHYMPIVSPDGKPLPCVIYCHGNSGCRADASEAAIILLPSNITVFTLDFSGSGISGGEYVSLGWNEKDDLKAVVDYLRADGNVSLIGLWGRSMGAVTSLMYGAEDPSIAGVVLDSPFSDLVDLMMELVDTYKFRLPKFTVKFAIQYMRKTIQKKAKFDIMDLNTIKVAKSCFVPVLFGHAIDDDFIRPHHSDRIFEAYMVERDLQSQNRPVFTESSANMDELADGDCFLALLRTPLYRQGDKNIIKFEGDHNSPRPQFYFDSINIFFHNVLQPPEDEVGGTFFDTMHDYFDKGSWDKLHEGYANHDSGPSTVAESATSSTEDAIKRLRSRRLVSRIDVPSDVPSKDKQFEGQDEGGEKKSFPSSSNMINFELSNGHPYGPHVPTSMDDDIYVEYPLDNMADFPSNVEEEDRMFMEAMLMSLKDLEMRCPQAEEQQPSVDNGTDNLPKSSSQEDNPNASSKTECCKTESTSTSISNAPDLASQQLSPDTSASSLGPPFDTPPSCVESGSTGTSVRSDTSVDVRSSSDADTVGNTKATLTVVKNPTNHIMDGLMRRWDLNFFRNSK